MAESREIPGAGIVCLLHSVCRVQRSSTTLRQCHTSRHDERWSGSAGTRERSPTGPTRQREAHKGAGRSSSSIPEGQWVHPSVYSIYLQRVSSFRPDHRESCVLEEEYIIEEGGSSCLQFRIGGWRSEGSREMGTKMPVGALILIFLMSQAYARDVDYCFADEGDPYLYMATKTAYHFVHPGKTEFQNIPDCDPVQVWMLANHGTRCPTLSEITEMLGLVDIKNQIIQNHETRGEGRMCNRDLENLKKWQPDAYLAVERAEVLTPQGVEDMKLLAGRLQSSFPELLQPSSEDMVPANYKFRAADARNSMESFMDGLFGSRTAIIPEESPENDTLLAAHKNCPAWEAGQTNNSIEELRKFDNGPHFQNLLRNVSQRLGYLYDISKGSILTMYDMCRYEKAWSVTKLSPWCAIFSKQELRLLEYREDLEYYYKAGYGREINGQLGCILLKDMVNHFWRVERDESASEPKGVFYFSDAVSLLNLLTAMGINQDDVLLRAYNYNAMAKRQWRTSFISPFVGNLIAVFYKCHGSRETNKAMFYLAEKPILLEGCDVGLCDWEYLKNKFGPLTSHCGFEMCSEMSGSASRIAMFFDPSTL
ncbi:hypothetical protein KM043_011745 [Ampulex compressa]|nr:hypothetical protein KM043_011745 [Ampulex compressa]